MTKSIKEEHNKTNKLFLLAMSIFFIDISLLYINNVGHLLLNQTMLITLLVSFICGLFHALKTIKLVKSVDENDYPLTLIFLSLIYTAWYNVILLSISGIAVLEWALFALIIFSDFILTSTGKNNQSISYIGSSDVTLIILGAIMFIGKWIFYVLAPDNIYVQMFTGNTTARNIILIFCIVGLIYLLSSLIRFAKAKISVSEKQKSKTKNFFKKIGKMIKIFFSLIFKGPAAIIVLFCLILIGGIIIFSEGKTICNDVLNFVEPILKKLSSTGKATIVPSIFYFISEFIVLASVLIFFFSYRQHLEKLAEKKLENELAENVKNLKIPEQEKLQLYNEGENKIKNEKHFIQILGNTEQRKLLTNISKTNLEGK